MAFMDPGSEPDAPQAPASDAPGPPGQGDSDPPRSPPGGSSPFMAFLGRQQMGPQPTAPGPGDMSQGTVLMTQAHGLLTQALQMFPGQSQQYKDVHRALGVLGRHMSQNAPTAGAQQTNIMDQIRNIAKNTLLQHIMSSGGQGASGGPPGGGGPGGGEAGGGGGPMALPGGPAPSMPFPGA